MDVRKYVDQLKALAQGPKRPVRPRRPTPDHGPEGLRAYADELEVYLKELKAWELDVADRKAQQQRLLEKFKEAALEDVGLSCHRSRATIYNYAWQRGHGSGLHEVLNELRDVA